MSLRQRYDHHAYINKTIIKFNNRKENMKKITKEIFIDGKFDVIVEKQYISSFNYLGAEPELDHVVVTLMWENHKVTSIGMRGYEYARLRKTKTFKDLWFWDSERAQKYYDMTTERLLSEVNARNNDLSHWKLSEKARKMFGYKTATWIGNTCKFENELGQEIIGKDLKYDDDDEKFKRQFKVEVQ